MLSLLDCGDILNKLKNSEVGAGVAEPDEGLVYRSEKSKIDLSRRELRVNGAVVPIGARGFDIIAVLVQSAGRVISKDDLMGRVWPDTIIGENTLQVHISALRNALGPDRDLLRTVSGRGYRLVGNWTTQSEPEPETTVDPAPTFSVDPPLAGNLSLAGPVLVGREDAVRQIGDLVSAYRAVTLTGPGGIGKTTLALETARALLPVFQGEVWLVELASVLNPDLVSSAVARVLGVRLIGAEISPVAVARAIGGRKLLLVLDNCEHVIDAAARFVEAVTHTCPDTSVLATSRELLRIEGEYAYRVPPLGVPPAEERNPDTILGHSAVRFFISRVRATNAGFSPATEGLQALAGICRRLDGIPLAIEFAASRVATLGIDHVASRLNDRFSLLRGGRRTAVPRHQTLRATLDWSYELLPNSEQRLLCGLAVFAGGFTLNAAAAVASQDDDSVFDTEDGIANLVAKSLVTLDDSSARGRWRLLETIRAYASEKLAESGEARTTARRHAAFLRDLLGRATLVTPGEMTVFLREIDNVRAALDWAFSVDGDSSIGIALTAAFARVWIHASLMSECQARVERALSAVANSGSGDAADAWHEMVLYLALGSTLIYTSGPGPETTAAWTKALESAERSGDIDHTLRAVWGLWLGRLNVGEFRESLMLAEKFRRLVPGGSDPVNSLIGERMMGFSLHFLGDQTTARQHIERMLGSYDSRVHQSHIVRFQFDQRVTAHIRLAIILWLQGYPDRAMRGVEECIAEASAGGHAATLAMTLAQGACRVALECGDFVAASRFVAMLLEQSARHELRFLHDLGRCFEGTLLVKQGELDRGLIQLRDTMNEPAVARHGIWFSSFLCDLGDAYTLAGDSGMAQETLDRAVERTERLGERWCRPELLRLKGRLAVQRGLPDDAAEGEAMLRQSLHVATDQATLTWQLRTATTLAGFWRDQGRVNDARDMLAPVYGRFTEGFSTADLRNAGATLAELG